MLEIFITIIHVLVCAFLILVILLQAGRGGGVSAAFGGGAGIALGQRSAANVLNKVTAGCAVTFMVTSMSLAAMSSPTADDPLQDAAEQMAPAVPATAIEGAAPATTFEGAAPAAPATAMEGAAPVTAAAPAEGAVPPALPEGAAPAPATP